MAARLGGDEFGVLITGITEDAGALGAADRIHALLSVPVELGGAPVPVGVSLGVAVDTAETRGADDLLGAADVAMYRAKAAGKGTVRMAPLEGLADGNTQGRVGVRRLRPMDSARLDESPQPG